MESLEEKSKKRSRHSEALYNTLSVVISLIVIAAFALLMGE